MKINKQIIQLLSIIACINIISCGERQTGLIIDTTNDEIENNNAIYKKRKKEKVEKYKNFINERPDLKKDNRYKKLYNTNLDELDKLYLEDVGKQINEREENEILLTKYKKPDKANYNLDELKKKSDEEIKDIKYINKEIEKIHNKYKLDNIKKDDKYFGKDDKKIIENIKNKSYAKQKTILKKIAKRNKLMQQIINSKNKMYVANYDNLTKKYTTEEINGKNIFEYENKRKDNGDDLENRLTTRIEDLESIIKTNEAIKKIYDNKYLADPENNIFYVDKEETKANKLKMDLFIKIGASRKERLQAINDKNSLINLTMARGKYFKNIAENKKYKIDKDDKIPGISQEKLAKFIKYPKSLKSHITTLKLIVEANKKNKPHLIISSKRIRTDKQNKTFKLNNVKKYIIDEKYSFDIALKKEANTKNIFNVQNDGKNMFNYLRNSFFNKPENDVKLKFFEKFFDKLFKSMKELYDFNKEYIKADYDIKVNKSPWLKERLKYNTFKEIIKSQLKLKIQNKNNVTSFVENLNNSYTNATKKSKQMALKQLKDYLEKNDYIDKKV